MTRFVENSPLWPKFKSLWPFLKPSFHTGEIIEPTLANFIAFGQIFIGVSGQILKIFLPSGHTSKVHKGSFTLSAF